MTAPMTLLALSGAPATLGADRWVGLERAAQRALRQVTVADAVAEPIPDGKLFLGGSGTWSQLRSEVPGAGPVVRLSLGARSAGGRELDAAAIGERLARGDVDDVAPPFAACAVLADGGLVAATDALGLRHVYWTEGDGWAAVSTSSLALAILAGAAPDEEAVGAFALVGNHLGERTPFAGVSVLPGGATIRLAKGRADVRRPVAAGGPPSPLGFPEAVAAGAEVVRGLAAACLAAYPDPLLELSGGLDSRLVLAGIPPPRRAGLRAATVGPPGSADHRIAAALARRFGMRHTAVTVEGLAALDPDEVAGLAEAAAAARDCGGNPLALAVLDWQEGGLDQGPRLTGQNGEFARGFYYPGQRQHPGPDGGLVDALARWRVFTNDAVDPGLFAAGFLDYARSSTLRMLRAAFASYGTDWLTATDEFYLRERMRRWVGIAYSSACMRRVVQAPFFHPDYVRWARSCAPSDKRGSRVFAAVLASLDPALAAVPLDSGRTPRAIAAPSPLERLTSARTTVVKVIRKVDQRVRRRGRPASGAGIVAAGVQDAWSRRDGALAELAGLPFLDGRAVEEAARGARPLDPPSVALLVNLDVALRAARRAAG